MSVGGRSTKGKKIKSEEEGWTGVPAADDAPQNCKPSARSLSEERM